MVALGKRPLLSGVLAGSVVMGISMPSILASTTTAAVPTATGIVMKTVAVTTGTKVAIGCIAAAASVYVGYNVYKAIKNHNEFKKEKESKELSCNY